MDSAINFANSLQGKTCFVSRVRKGINPIPGIPLFTLHQIVFKILKSGERGQHFTPHLHGPESKFILQKALQENGNLPNQLTVNEMDYRIRSHKNKAIDMNSDFTDAKYLSLYQQYLNNSLDWEDSLQLATWLIQNDDVRTLYKFSFQNIILVKPELLAQQNNRNAREFFEAWSEWITNYTRWNIYSINQYGIVTQIQAQKKTANHSISCLL